MKKIFMTIFTILFFTSVQCFAGIIVQNNTGTVINDGLVNQNLTMTFESVGATGIRVTALENYVTNLNDSTIKIPVSNIFITCDGSKTQLQYQSAVRITRTRPFEFSNMTLPAILNIENIGALPAGTYSTPLRFMSISMLGPSEFVYNLTFVVPPKLSMSASNSQVQIKISGEDIFKKNVAIKNIANIQINLDTNKAWELYLDAQDLGELKGKYFVKVVGRSNVSNYQSEILEISRGHRYFLASGDCTIKNPPFGQKIPTYLVLEYSFQNNQDRYVDAGTSYNQIKYVLEEK